jgi:poly-gamma-glutamate synthesis protein (capsule biosynthesis protein)
LQPQFHTLRSAVVSGSSIAAFVVGCWLGYADAPSEQTHASAAGSGGLWPTTQVKAARESVSVQHPKAANSQPELSLLFGGNVELSPAYLAAVGNNNGWSLGSMAEIRQADISMVNLDTTFAQNRVSPTAGADSPAQADPNRVDVLLSGGVDLVNLANHTTTQNQAAGLSDTLTTLNRSKIQTVGAGRNAQEARRPVIMEVKGQRVAYLGYYDSDLQAASDRSAGINPRRNDMIAEDIQALRQQVDWIVVNYHWGEALAKYPGDWQIDLAHFTIDQGADLVVGYHSHSLQGAEVYKGRPIIYSLGNFIFGNQPSQEDQPEHQPAQTDKSVGNYDTAVLQVGLKDRQMRVELLPVAVRNYQARVVSGDEGQAILKQVTNISDIFPQPLVGSMVLDANNNTTPTKPTPQTTPAATPSAMPTPSSGTAPEGTPTSPAELAPSPQASDSAPAPNGHPWTQDSFIDNSGQPKSPLSQPMSQQDAATPTEQPLAPLSEPGFDGTPDDLAGENPSNSGSTVSEPNPATPLPEHSEPPESHPLLENPSAPDHSAESPSQFPKSARESGFRDPLEPVQQEFAAQSNSFISTTN